MILVQRITSLANERNEAFTMFSDGQRLSPCQEKLRNISFHDSFCYCFSFLGVLVGPFYTFSTYYDSFHLPFNLNTSDRKQKINEYTRIIIISFLTYLIISNVWPIEFSLTDEFYEQRSCIYRIFYMIPMFLIFRTRLYAGAKLGEITLICASIGCYPRVLCSRSGNGPTKEINHDILENHLSYENDFETINMFNIKKFESCLYFREAIRDHWNKCVQFWLYKIFYKKVSKRFSLIVTQLMSSLWHGLYSGYFFCIITPAIYIPIENIFRSIVDDKRIKMTKLLKNSIDASFWIMKSFALVYMNVAFCLRDFSKFWKFYNSIHHIGHIFFALLFLIGSLILKIKNK